ncbi:FAD-dependent oxidoreductase [soil metagenome]
MTTEGKRAVVIGGGVVGAASAYFLVRDGWQVTIVDQGEFGRACSHGNCGYVCPSHVLPLAVPGAIRDSLKALLSPNSPFTIRPRFSPSLWSWLLSFARRCNKKDMLTSGTAIQALLRSSRTLYPEILEREHMDCEWENRGLMFVFQTQAAMDHYEATDRLLREQFQMPARRLDSATLAGMEPALKPGLAGAWHYEGDSHLRADRLMAAWKVVLERLGVVVRTRCKFNNFDSSSGTARVANTDAGEIAGDLFVLATGAWTPLLNKDLGCKIPIQPGKGYSITMPRPAICPTYPLILEEHRVAITPFRSGYRIGSTMEFAGYDSTLNRSRLDLLRDSAKLYLHEPTCEPVQEEWFGWRPMTPDSVPIIDWSPALGNVMVAAGHNMLGLSMAPATGKLIAEMAGRRTPHVDPAPYSVRRF